MWVTFIIDYYMNALCPFFLSYWIHLLLYMFTWMEFPRIRSFFFHNIWPARYKRENPPPNKPFYYVLLFFFYRISPCLICYLATTKWVLYVALYLLYNEVPFYTMLWNIRWMRNFCCIILCNTRFLLSQSMRI